MNIYISNLGYGVNDADLNSLFSEYGEIASAQVITDRNSGRSRGFGFVEMTNEEEGRKAIEGLNETEYDGRTINVNVARPRAERADNDRGYGSSRGGYNSGRY